jgi:hypothetical protein
MMPPDPVAMLRSRSYPQLLVLAAVLGVPVSAVAYGFLGQRPSRRQGFVWGR